MGGGDKDNGDVREFDVGVVDPQDDVDGLILVVVIIIIDRRKRGAR